MAFLDEVVVQLSSGAGGPGCLSFRREKYLPRGGPDGGDGGDGGNLILVARQHLTTLDDVIGGQRHFHAGRGQPGGPKKCHGKRGADFTLEVPVGTIVRDADRGHVLLELMTADEPVCFASGGRGGRGNWSFRNPRRQAPRITQDGKPAIERKVWLELKLLADVGLLGFPNAGKSTLLSAISRAHPKVGNYPFTTLAPKVGTVEYDFELITIADLPGILEGAHEGHGLGDRFLRHIERTRVLLHLLDASTSDLDELMQRYDVLRKELEEYGRGLDEKPEIVVFTKADERIDPMPVAEFAALTKVEPLVISAVEKTGLDELTRVLFQRCRPELFQE